jgi:hypothetical protein
VEVLRVPGSRASRLSLGLAMLGSGIAILWLNRGTTFWVDEIAWVLQSPELGFEDALRPHEGHLVFVTRLVYKASLELFGTAYLPMRLLGLAALWATVVGVFAFAVRRVPAVVALAPCLVLLVFGSDMLHVLVGNAFTIDLALACGVGALLALERDDGRGRVLACALLCLGVLTYTVALAFVVAAAVAALLRGDRTRRLWVAAVPAAVWVGWWLWARAQGFDSADAASVENALLYPSWSFQSLGHVLGALSGLDFDFGGTEATAQAGPALALVALAALGWRFRQRVPATLLVVAAIPLTLWAMGALTANEFRVPASARYMLPGAVAVLLVAAEACRGLSWSRGRLLLLYAVVAAGVATNLYLLHDAGADLRDRYAVQERAAFAALDVAGEAARREFEIPAIGEESIIPGGQSPLQFPFGVVSEYGRSPVDSYRRVAAEYGSLGYSPAELEAQGEAVRMQADAVLVAALGLRQASAPVVAGGECTVARSAGGLLSVELPPGGALLEAHAPAGELGVRRFAGGGLVPLGPVAAGTPVALRVPTDGLTATKPWVGALNAQSLRVCPLR